MMNFQAVVVISSLFPTVFAFTNPNLHRDRGFLTRPFGQQHRWLSQLRSSGTEDEDGDTINLDDERLYAVELPASTGIQWGSELSLRWVRVLGFEDGSPAPLSGVEIGDQLVAVEGESVCGSPLSDAVQCFGDLRKSKGSDALVSVVFFRGGPEELRAVVSAAYSAAGKDAALLGGGVMDTEKEGGECTITVLFAPEAKRLGVGVVNQGGAGLGLDSLLKSPSAWSSSSPPPRGSTSDGKLVLKCKPGSNLRDVLVANGVNVYRSLTRWTNCSGKQLCGTCIVEVNEGLDQCSRRGLDEASTLRQNPPSYRLSCVTDVYGDLTVTVGGEVGAEQWTR